MKYLRKPKYQGQPYSEYRNNGFCYIYFQLYVRHRSLGDTLIYGVIISIDLFGKIKFGFVFNSELTLTENKCLEVNI